MSRAKVLSFWDKAWKLGQTPWASEQADKFLIKNINRAIRLAKFKKKAALVPLCGDSQAMRILYSAGFKLTGVEYSATAIRKLRKRRFGKLRFKRSTLAHGKLHTARRLQIFEQDFFKFKPTPEYSLIYDRAALVAISPKLRKQYVKNLSACLIPRGIILLITATTSGPGAKNGPPYSVSKSEVKKLFSNFKILKCQSDKPVPATAHIKAMGINKRQVTYWILQKTN